ncbi:Diaminopimelate decarboxylase (plasmid) [Rhodovulum sp. P5]|uniref:hypothetical protein n=1 Tax=Rhodovulum sp. P5 TaxID=1564506 RepID=UPI0009C3A0DF|nr:hypothetical protein [Rhodovulum sp. P5]ARE42309.1 Diaminopimelate decarboxylase [Rhodovulum sp. P5]
MSEAGVAAPTLGRKPDTTDPGKTAPWWQRDDLTFRRGRLHLGTADLDALARKVGTPAYVVRAPRVAEKLRQLHRALDGAGLDHRIHYAIKANRTPQLLSYLAGRGLCGADVCSPEELLHALACGFREEDISFTGTSLSPADIEALARFDGIAINFDSLAALERYGRLCPGRKVGIRINPDRGIGYGDSEMLQYSGANATKFGIYLDRLSEAIEIAEKHGLEIARIHFHAGCGYLDREMEQFAAVLTASRAFTDRLPHLTEVNIGGGLGVPHRAGDRPLDLTRWASVIAAAFGGRKLTVAVEPGDFLVKDAGVLLASVTYRERRKEVEFLGLDAGFNLAMEPAFYDLPCEPVPAVPRDAPPARFTIVGNVNEALDKWAEDHPMPAPDDGDVIALINAGGYAASMRSDHCLRARREPSCCLTDDGGAAPGAVLPPCHGRPMTNPDATDTLSRETETGVTPHSPDFAFDPSDPWTQTFQMALEKAELSGKRVYEVGIGTGVNAAFLLQMCGAARVSGSDLDPRMADLAERNVRSLAPAQAHRFHPINGPSA